MNKSNFLPLREIFLTGIIGGSVFVSSVVLAPQYFPVQTSPPFGIGMIALTMILGSFWTIRANNFATNFLTRFSASVLTYFVLLAVSVLAIEYFGKDSAPLSEEEMSVIIEISAKNIAVGSAGSLAVAVLMGFMQSFLRPKTAF